MNTMFVLPTGTIECLYTEAIDLPSVGQLHIERISHLEFNEKRQRWQVLDRAEKCLFESPTRKDCLQFEQTIFSEWENLRRSRQ